MNDYAPCPNCAASEAAPVGFTWWGGVVGPKIINHVSCRQCGNKYNGKTGKSNLTGILIYTAVVALIAFVLGLFLISLR